MDKCIYSRIMKWLQYPRAVCKRQGVVQNIFCFIIISGILFFISPSPAEAGGLYIQEFGTPSTGVAASGAEAVAMDASTSFHNPAGMTRIKGREFMLTGGLVYSTIEFDPDPDTPIPGNDGGDAGTIAPLLGAFYVHSLSDRLKLGFNLFSLSAAALDYDNAWAGRYYVQNVSIFTLTANPTIAYRVNDWLSIAGGATFIYGKLEQDVAVLPPTGMGEIEIDGDDVDAGFNLGALFELSERTRLGIVYFSQLDLNLSGDIDISPIGVSAGIDTDLPMPQFVRLGIYHEINQRFALLGTVGWEDWSQMDNIFVSVARGSAKLPRNWDDTWHIGGGIHYRPSELWLLQAGIGYDTDPTDSDDRTPDMPIDRQWRYAVGAQYKWSEKISIGGAFEYADYGDGEINNDLLKGEYDKNDLFFLTFNVNWKL
jgi:long-chain fatty acid transport protein